MEHKKRHPFQPLNFICSVSYCSRTCSLTGSNSSSTDQPIKSPIPLQNNKSEFMKGREKLCQKMMPSHVFHCVWSQLCLYKVVVFFGGLNDPKSWNLSTPVWHHSNEHVEQDDNVAHRVGTEHEQGPKAGELLWKKTFV